LGLQLQHAEACRNSLVGIASRHFWLWTGKHAGCSYDQMGGVHT
jgi:hypothetical protein